MHTSYKTICQILFMSLLAIILRTSIVYSDQTCDYTISSITDASLNLEAGKTLCLLDGTYYQSLSISKSGTASAPITIRAVNDGKVTIDANYDGRPLTLTGNYWVFEGIIFTNSSIDDIVNVKGDYNVFRRCSFYYGLSKHGLAIDEGQHNLVEDCVAAGGARHQFKSWSDEGMLTNNTFRRCFAVGTMPNDDDAISNRSEYNIYGGSQDIIENCIGWGSTEYASISVHSQGYESTYKCKENVIRGSIFMRSGKDRANPDPGLGLLISKGVDGDQEIPKDNHFENCVIYNNNYGVRLSSSYNTLFNHCTIMNSSHYGLSSENASDIIKNTLLYNNNQGFSSTNGSFSYINSYGNNSSNVPPNNCQHCSTLNPGQIGLTIPSNSPLKGAGENGEDIGANICYRYDKNGNLTNEPLWPWPMADRIKVELEIDIMTELEQIFGPIPEQCKSISNQDDTPPACPAGLKIVP